MTDTEFFKALLVREVVPATGCTEIGAVALATGWAVQALGGPPDEIEQICVEVDSSTYKNALGVGIPGTDKTGLDFAAAMGAGSAKKVQHGLQILEDPEREAVATAQRLMAENKIRIVRLDESKEIVIQANVRGRGNNASAVIRGSHDHVVGVERNGKPYNRAPVPEESFWSMPQRVKELKYSTIIDFVKSVDVSELPVVREAAEMNMTFAKEARKMLPALQIGKVMEKYMGQGLTGKGLPAEARFITALAVEARMKGLNLPVMACAGSGNQGLVATIPVVQTANLIGVSEEQLFRALILSYLTTIYIKTYTGLLSPICGCGVAAAVGAGCGMIFLLGGDASQIQAQINNMVGTMAGIICDGAKSGCALKALMAIGLAVDSVYLSLENVRIPSTEGIVGEQVADTLRNLQTLIETGMPLMDGAIVKVIEKKRSEKTDSGE